MNRLQERLRVLNLTSIFNQRTNCPVAHLNYFDNKKKISPAEIECGYPKRFHMKFDFNLSSSFVSEMSF